MSDITPPYKVWPGLQSHPLGEHALNLREKYLSSGKIKSRLSPLIAMSDPIRTPDTIRWAENLPDHCAIIYRYIDFDPNIARSLRNISQKKRQQLLLRSKALDANCDGLHFIRSTSLEAIQKFQVSNSKAITTLAALKHTQYPHPLPPVDGLLVSAIFPSQSPSAGDPIGVQTLRQKVERFAVPVYALGGINPKTAPELSDTGIAGIAAVGALTQENTMTKNTTDKRTGLKITKSESGDKLQFKAQFPGLDDEAVLDLNLVAKGVYNAHHTGVPKSMGGQGVGTALVKAMSEDAKNMGYKIIPGCPFVAVWFKRKPEWAEMAALNPEDFKT